MSSWLAKRSRGERCQDASGLGFSCGGEEFLPLMKLPQPIEASFCIALVSLFSAWRLSFNLPH